jgi:hypothetical protein
MRMRTSQLKSLGRKTRTSRLSTCRRIYVSGLEESMTQSRFVIPTIWNAATDISTHLIRTLTAQLQYMRLQLEACESRSEKDVVERMAANLESAPRIAEDMGHFVRQLADGGQTGLVEVLAERGNNRDIGRGRVGLERER